MTIFISGGCKTGKSSLAEKCTAALGKGGPLYYIATMIPHDDEDHARIRRHIAQRDGMGFITLEEGYDLNHCLEAGRVGGSFILDSVTALLSNRMFCGMDFNPSAGKETADNLREFISGVGNAVFVSDFIYSDAGLYDEYTEAYRKGLALCDRTLAELCDTVIEVCSTNYIVHKGALPF